MSVNKTLVICIPGSTNAEDEAVLINGEYVGKYSNKTLAQFQEQNPEYIVKDWVEFCSERDEKMKTEPVEITEEKFWDALEVLPPEDWARFGRTESFKMCEYFCGMITAVYARIGDKYYTFHDVATIQHDEIIAKIQNHTAALAVAG